MCVIHGGEDSLCASPSMKVALATHKGLMRSLSSIVCATDTMAWNHTTVWLCLLCIY